jgi:hypothetical protein
LGGLENRDGARARVQGLHAIAGVRGERSLSLRVFDYVALVDWSGRVVREGKRGAIAADAPPALAKLGLRELQWQSQMLGIESRYWRAVGTIESLAAKARALGQCWLKGGGSRTRLA